MSFLDDMHLATGTGDDIRVAPDPSNPDLTAGAGRMKKAFIIYDYWQG